MPGVTDERLAEIKRRHESSWMTQESAQDVFDLLDEVQRQKKEHDGLAYSLQEQADVVDETAAANTLLRESCRRLEALVLEKGEELRLLKKREGHLVERLKAYE